MTTNERFEVLFDNNEGRPSSYQCREMYAHFGLAYYYAECLFDQMCLYYVSYAMPVRGMTRSRYDDLLAFGSAQTMGKLIELLQPMIPAEIAGELNEALSRRNLLAHGYWQSRAHLTASVSGCDQMIEELKGLIAFFQEIDHRLTSITRERFEPFVPSNIEELKVESFKDLLAGNPYIPYTGPRKLQKKERLVSAWIVTSATGCAFYFRNSDGYILELCDAGMCWSEHTEPEPDWKPMEKVNQWLPADVNPRPKNYQPWNYEFTLKDGARLFIKLEQQSSRIRCGVVPPGD